MQMAQQRRIKLRFTHELALLLVLVGLFVTFGLLEPAFFRPRVYLDVFNIVGEIGIMALAMTYIISTGGV
ncbi:MAG: hypothetical protein EA404_08655, partial [Spirochaetaceae bacterium]